MRNRSFQFALAASLLTAIGGSRAFAAQQAATWLGGNGSWTDATKWSTGVVPNNNAANTYNVNIDNANPANSEVFLQGGGYPNPTYTVDALAIDSGDSLRLEVVNLQLNQSPTIHGSLTLGHEGAVLLPAGATVSGTGEIIVQSGSTNLAAASGTLTIDSGITVHGGGIPDSYFTYRPGIGSSAVALVNKGIIRADAGLIRISGSSIDNQGMIEVGANSVLFIDADFNLATFGNFVRSDSARVAIARTQTNTGQTLNVSRPRGWTLAGGTITGGTLTTSGAGTIYAGYLSGGTLDNVTLNGLVEVDGTLNVTGTLAGNGMIKINNPEAIEGLGNVNIGTIPAGITVRGGISEQYDGMWEPAGNRARVSVSSNQGVIRAQKSIFNDAGRLRILAFGGGTTITNTGSLEVSDGGTMISLNNLTFGTNGKLVVDGGGLLDVTGNLNLATSFDALDIRPRLDGQAYVSQLIATYTGTQSGTFNTVTPGISVQYLFASKQIRISGTPVPEPAAVGLMMGMLVTLACRRRRLDR